MRVKDIFDARDKWRTEHGRRPTKVFIHPDDAKAFIASLPPFFPAGSNPQPSLGPGGMTFHEDAETPKGTVRFA